MFYLICLLLLLLEFIVCFFWCLFCVCVSVIKHNAEATLYLKHMNKETKVTFDKIRIKFLFIEIVNDSKILLLMDQIKSRQIVIIITNNIFVFPLKKEMNVYFCFLILLTWHHLLISVMLVVNFNKDFMHNVFIFINMICILRSMPTHSF